MNKIVRSGLHLLIISAITAVFGVLTVVGVSANEGDTFDVGNLTYTVTAEGAFPTVEVESCNRNVEGAVDIPCVVTNNKISYSVTSIGDGAFDYCESLTSVTIPESVTMIRGSAFSCCTALTSVTIPDSVKNIGYEAFFNCTNLTSVTIPNSVTSIKRSMFYNCTNLTSVTIPNSVTSIEEFAFGCCSSLTSIIIPESVTSIGNEAFCDCINLSVVISHGSFPATIGDDVFTNCSSNLSICIPSGTLRAYVASGWPEDNLLEMSKFVKVIDESGNPIEGAKVMIYLKEYTPVALTKGYTNSEGIYTCPVDTPCDTIEVKKSGYKQVETRVSDNFELVVVMEKI